MKWKVYYQTDYGSEWAIVETVSTTDRAVDFAKAVEQGDIDEFYIAYKIISVQRWTV